MKSITNAMRGELEEIVKAVSLMSSTVAVQVPLENGSDVGSDVNDAVKALRQGLDRLTVRRFTSPTALQYLD